MLQAPVLNSEILEGDEVVDVSRHHNEAMDDGDGRDLTVNEGGSSSEADEASPFYGMPFSSSVVVGKPLEGGGQSLTQISL